MATEQISLNKLYRHSLHVPETKDGFALYTKVDGYKGAMEGEANAEKSADYMKACQDNYNSPTNIRRVFITGSRIYVECYKSYIYKGESFRLIYNKKLKSNLFEIIMKKMTYRDDLAKYNMSKAAGMKEKEPVNYRLTGNGIGIFSSPWVCSNIEEIYFDWTIMAADESGPFFQEFQNPACYEAFLTHTEPSEERPSEEIQRFFETFNMGGTKDIRKRFPRLRFIAMISRLDDIANPGNNFEPTIKYLSDLSIRDVDESKKTWYEANRDMIAQSGSLVRYCDLSSDLTFPNREFTVKSNQYKFDYEVLAPFIEDYKARLDKLARKKYEQQQPDENTSTEQEEPETDFEYTALEQKYIAVGEQYGEKAQNNALLYAVRGSGIALSDVKKMIQMFSKPNRLKAAKAIGLTL